jgi:hypothetical protein
MFRLVYLVFSVLVHRSIFILETIEVFDISESLFLLSYKYSRSLFYFSFPFLKKKFCCRNKTKSINHFIIIINNFN